MILDNPYKVYYYEADAKPHKENLIKSGYIFKDEKNNIFKIGKNNTKKLKNSFNVKLITSTDNLDINGTELDNFSNLKFNYITKDVVQLNRNLCIGLIRTRVSSNYTGGVINQRLRYVILYKSFSSQDIDRYWFTYNLSNEWEILTGSDVIKWAILDNHYICPEEEFKIFLPEFHKRLGCM